MNQPIRRLTTVLILAFCAWIGWWVARDFQASAAAALPAATPRTPAPRPLGRGWIRERQPQRDSFGDGATVEIFASRQRDEAILRFPSDETYSAFLFALGGSRIQLVDQIDRFRAVRLQFNEREDLHFLLLGENLAAYDSLPAVSPPAPVPVGKQPGLVGFGDGMLAWLGISGDNSGWGAGVKVAVLDTGVVPHPALPGLSKSIAVVPFPEDPAQTRSHGTAVASLIAGNDPRAPGVAPAVELISVRVSDDTGRADSFALARGIVDAIDADADIVNISMGCAVDNPLIAEAVDYARERGVLIVASSGNAESEDASYPAAYPGVISVGAVDARGEHLDFSNFGADLSLTAPGYAINAALPGGRYGRISGTSASAPIVTGAIAATMSSGHGVTMSAAEAAEIVMDHADEAGLAGPDSEYGVGILNVGRIMSRNQPGIVDAAITDQRVAGGNAIEITVQNRGTEVLVNTLLETRTPAGIRRFNITTLAPGAIRSFSIPFSPGRNSAQTGIEAASTLTLGNRGPDITPYNNQRSDTLFVH
jgi:hypothetical protein